MDLKREGYWEEHYEKELENFDDNGDEGDVWFGESLTKRIVNKIFHKLTVDEHKLINKIDVLDIGCGNAFLLCKLLERLLEHHSLILDRVRLAGIDYAEKSIELSKKIVKSRDFTEHIKLAQCNFLDLNQLQSVVENRKFQIVVDKGTFDAICLLADDVANVKTRYMQSIYSIVKSGSIFIFASCNHTEDELLKLFRDGPIRCELLERIETPKIKFGGVEGSQVCCLVIKFH